MGEGGGDRLPGWRYRQRRFLFQKIGLSQPIGRGRHIRLPGRSRLERVNIVEQGKDLDRRHHFIGVGAKPGAPGGPPALVGGRCPLPMTQYLLYIGG